MNKEENDAPCAAREARGLSVPGACQSKGQQAKHDGVAASQVYEETGFDVSDLIVDSDFVETVQNQQRTKLFIIADIDESVRVDERAVCSAMHCVNPFPFSWPATPNRRVSRRRRARRSAALRGTGWMTCLQQGVLCSWWPQSVARNTCRCMSRRFLWRSGSHEGKLKYFMVHPFVTPLRQVRDDEPQLRPQSSH